MREFGAKVSVQVRSALARARSTRLADARRARALCAAASLLAACALTLAARVDDPAVRLGQLLRRLRERPELLAGPTFTRAKEGIADLRLTWSIDPSSSEDAARALLDVVGQYADAPGEADARTPEAELRDAAVAALEAHFDPAFGRWLTTEILPETSGAPLERRVAVARLLERNTVPSSKEPLLACARERDRRLANSARRALSGWSDEAVHELFWSELGGTGNARDFEHERLAEQHFATTRFAPDSAVARLLGLRLRAEVVDRDWRVASRAVRLSHALENEAIVPPLIEGLSAWKARGEAGAQSLRLRYEIRRALRERSGRAFGLDPKEWRDWWTLVRAGRVRGMTPQSAGGFAESTEASFFGIRPQSDRIVFVIDRSGSMNEPFRGTAESGTAERGTAPRTRFDEATRQLSAFLESMGPTTKFDVVLFHDLADSFRGRLVPATPENLAAVREWMNFQKPAGGTRLRSGVLSALHVGEDGHLDLAALEADTVIVLCDGETGEGPGWVAPFLEEFGTFTRTVFHGIQVGPDGDATMPRLSQGSRGDFVRMDG